MELAPEIREIKDLLTLRIRKWVSTVPNRRDWD